MSTCQLVSDEFYTFFTAENELGNLKNVAQKLGKSQDVIVMVASCIQVNILI